MTGYLLEALQLALTLALAPGLVGLVRWLKARLQNRRGAPPWQPYFELRKLFGKEVVMSRNASWLFRLALYLIFASSAAVALFAPVLVTPLAAPLGALSAWEAAFGLVEGWRGAVLHWVMAGDDGRLHRVKVKDPSFANWPALSFALLKNIVPDFRLCNKSFNPSYAGNDL